MRLLRTPLAWHNLTHNRRRFLVALGGIGFAVVLMFMETGFHNALLDSTVKVLDDLNADVIITSRGYKTYTSAQMFDRERLYQVQGSPGVKAAYPVYLQLFGCMWKGPGLKAHPIRVLACDPASPVFKIPSLAQHATELDEPETALVDAKSKDKYGLPREPDALVRLRGAELEGRSVRVVGAFEMGTDFLCDGTAIVSPWNFARYLPNRTPGHDPLSAVNLVAVQLADPARASQAAAELNARLPEDVLAWTKPELVAAEKEFWNKGTGVGFIFQLGKWIGFLVGVTICYQIINADITDHLAEYATLKALGYRNRYFLGLVLQEAFLLSLLSFAAGLPLSMALYGRLGAATGMLMILTPPRAASIFVLTVLMCAVSGLLVMRKVLTADPAELY
jgi:putative ABC transport system permease protein